MHEQQLRSGTTATGEIGLRGTQTVDAESILYFSFLLSLRVAEVGYQVLQALPLQKPFRPAVRSTLHRNQYTAAVRSTPNYKCVAVNVKQLCGSVLVYEVVDTGLRRSCIDSSPVCATALQCTRSYIDHGTISPVTTTAHRFLPSTWSCT